jgi:hypothetical protein
LNRRVIAVIGAAGTIGRRVVEWLEAWGIVPLRRDFRLDRDEHVDIRRPGSVARALEGASVCVNCADYRLNLDVMRAALRAGSHYVDLGGLFHLTRRQLELDGRFRAAGLTAILGLGSAPGKTNLLAGAAVARLRADPTSLHIWAASHDPAATGHPLPAPYSVQTLRDELRMRPIVLVDGALVEVEPLSGESERELPEIGRTRGFYTLHSELATLPSAFPSLRRASFRLCLAEGLLAKLLALEEGELPEPYVQSSASVAVHLVEVGSNGRVVVGAAVTPGGSAKSTSEPAARAALEIAEGRLSVPGASPPEQAIEDPEGFLAQLDTDVRWAAT